MTQAARKPMGYWTEERCREVISLCTDQRQLRRDYPVARVLILRNGWCKDEMANLPKVIGKEAICTRKVNEVNAKKCKTISEFQKRFPGSYKAAWIGGYVKEICAHMKPIGNLKSRAIYVYEFENNIFYVGMTWSYEVRHSEHLQRKDTLGEFLNCTPFKHIKKDIFYSVEAACAEEIRLTYEYINKGWLSIAQKQPGSFGGNLTIYKPEDAFKIFKKYTNRRDARKSEPRMYGYACRAGIWQKVTAHMDPTVTKIYKCSTNFEECWAAACQCMHTKDFVEKFPKQYRFAYRNKLLKEVGAHFIPAPRPGRPKKLNKVSK